MATSTLAQMCQDQIPLQGYSTSPALRHNFTLPRNRVTRRQGWHHPLVPVQAVQISPDWTGLWFLPRPSPHSSDKLRLHRTLAPLWPCQPCLKDVREAKRRGLNTSRTWVLNYSISSVGRRVRTVSQSSCPSQTPGPPGT